MTVNKRPDPVPTTCSRPYWEAAEEGVLRLQYCPASERFQHYPRPFDVATLDADLEWREVGRRGTIYSYVVNHRPAGPAWADRIPYCLALVDLDEAPEVRLLAEVVGAEPDALAVGRAVEVVFETGDGDIALSQVRLVT